MISLCLGARALDCSAARLRFDFWIGRSNNAGRPKYKRISGPQRALLLLNISRNSYASRHAQLALSENAR